MRREKLQRLEDRWKVKEKWQKWNKEKRRIQIKHSMHWIYVLFFWMRLLCNFCCVVVFFSHGSFSKKGKNLVVYLRETMMVSETKNKWTKSISKSRRLIEANVYWRDIDEFFLFISFYFCSSCAECLVQLKGAFETHM